MAWTFSIFFTFALLVQAVPSRGGCSCRPCRNYPSYVERCRCCTFHLVGGKRSAMTPPHFLSLQNQDRGERDIIDGLRDKTVRHSDFKSSSELLKALSGGIGSVEKTADAAAGGVVLVEPSGRSGDGISLRDQTKMSPLLEGPDVTLEIDSGDRLGQERKYIGDNSVGNDNFDAFLYRLYLKNPDVLNLPTTKENKGADLDFSIPVSDGELLMKHLKFLQELINISQVIGGQN